MEQDIINWCVKNNNIYIKINNEKSIKVIHDLFFNNMITVVLDEIECLYYGIWFYEKKEYDIAKNYYLRIIEKNNHNIDALHMLSRVYRKTNDLDNMIKYALKSIEKGETRTMNDLGHYYKAQKDYENAKKYFLMGIDNNDTDSINYLGILYDDLGDVENMIKYYLLGIEKGNSDAMYNLALYYKKQKDNANTEKYFLLAIEKNDADAMYELAIFYKDNPELYKQYLLMAVKHNHTNALFKIGCYYNNNNDIYRAVKYWSMSADKGNIDAMISAGNYYYKINDDDEVFKYYSMACEKGNVEGVKGLGLYYQKKNDTENMIKYYKMAACLGDIECLNVLFQHYGNDLEAKIMLCNEVENNDKMIEFVIQYLSKKTDQVISPKIYEIIEKLDLTKFKDVPLFIQITVKLLKTKTDALLLHYQYSPQGQGFKEAKEDFYKKDLDYSRKRKLNTIDEYFEPAYKKPRKKSL